MMAIVISNSTTVKPFLFPTAPPSSYAGASYELLIHKAMATGQTAVISEPAARGFRPDFGADEPGQFPVGHNSSAEL
jgi:hypothetical protein